MLKTTEFCFILTQDIEAELAPIRSISILHTAYLMGIKMIMRLHISDSVYLSMRYFALKISQMILGTNRVRLN